MTLTSNVVKNVHMANFCSLVVKTELSPPCKNDSLTVPTDSEANVTTLADVGCAFMGNSLMTFDDARTFCQTGGGDIYAEGNFESLQEYLSTTSHVGKLKWGNERRNGYDQLSMMELLKGVKYDVKKYSSVNTKICRFCGLR